MAEGDKEDSHYLPSFHRQTFLEVPGTPSTKHTSTGQETRQYYEEGGTLNKYRKCTRLVMYAMRTKQGEGCSLGSRGHMEHENIWGQQSQKNIQQVQRLWERNMLHKGAFVHSQLS